MKRLIANLIALIVITASLSPLTIGRQQSPQTSKASGGALPKLRFPAGKDFVEVPFEVISNLMVIPVSLNGSRPLRYVLDTGAQGALLNSSTLADSLNLKVIGKASLRGAGGGGAPTEAAIVEPVTFSIGGIELSECPLVVRPAPTGPDPMSGHDGVIGRPVFALLVVEVDWERNVVRFYEPSRYKYSGKGEVLPLTIGENGIPYTSAVVSITGDKSIPATLVIDSGASHALSLDLGQNPGVTLPVGAQKRVLGFGASGEITGSTSRVKNLQLGSYVLNDVPTSFPDASAGTAGLGGRQGNLGAGVLKRFKVIYDYSRKQMILEVNRFFSDPFGTQLRIADAKTFEVAPAALSDYIGKYGNKEISVRDSGLYYQRIGGRGATLRPIGKDRFALNADALLTFNRNGDGAVTDLLIEWAERDKEQLTREAASNGNPTRQ